MINKFLMIAIANSCALVAAGALMHFSKEIVFGAIQYPRVEGRR